MMDINETQPLTEEQETAKPSLHDLANHPWVQALRQLHEEENQHIHGPFTFILNANHNALRGCQTCGQAWIGFMAGTVDNLVWHEVSEEEQEEQQ